MRSPDAVNSHVEVAVDISDHSYRKRLQGSVLPATTEEKIELLTEKIDEQG